LNLHSCRPILAACHASQNRPSRPPGPSTRSPQRPSGLAPLRRQTKRRLSRRRSPKTQMCSANASVGNHWNGSTRLASGRLREAMVASSIKRRVSAEQRRALLLLASSREGVNEELLLRAHRFSRVVLSSLVRRRLASIGRVVMKAGDKTVEVIRMRITSAGRGAIEE